MGKREHGDSNGGEAPSGGDAEPEAKKPKTESGAMKQGLQGWAEKVNGLAGTDAELVKACREFVRKRILKAHAEGNLHSVTWETEPVPTTEELRGGEEEEAPAG